MRKDKVLALLVALKTKKTGERAGTWMEAKCPFVWKHGGVDQHPSFGIKVSDKKKSICKCWSCGYGGDLQDLVLDIAQHVRKHKLTGYNLKLAMQLTANEAEDMDINPEDIPDYDAAIAEATEVVFPSYWLESFPKVQKYKEPMAYLLGRNMTHSMIEMLDVRYDPLQKRVCFPFYNFKGELMGVQGRDLNKESNLRYYQYGYNGQRNGMCWYGENRVTLDKPVVLVEGVFDYVSILRVYPNVLASFTSGLSTEKVKRVADADSIISLYDYGNGGNAAREALPKKLKKVPMRHLIPTELEDDAGNMTLEQVTAHLQGHVKLSSYVY